MPKPVSIILTATANQFTSAVDSGTASMDKMQEKASTLRSTLESVKEEAGRGSTLDEFGKTLAGAGAVIGVSLIGEELNKAADKMRDITQQFRDGKTDAEGLAVGIGESLPVLGKFVEAGQAVREAFTNEKGQIADINAEAKTMDDYVDAVRKTIVDSTKETAKWNDEITKTTLQLAKARATTPEGVKEADAAIKAYEDQKHSSDQLNESIEKRLKDRDIELQKSHAVADALQKAIDDSIDGMHNSARGRIIDNFPMTASIMGWTLPKSGELPPLALQAQLDAGSMKRAQEDIDKFKRDAVIKLALDTTAETVQRQQNYDKEAAEEKKKALEATAKAEKEAAEEKKKALEEQTKAVEKAAEEQRRVVAEQWKHGLEDVSHFADSILKAGRNWLNKDDDKKEHHEETYHAPEAIARRAIIDLPAGNKLSPKDQVEQNQWLKDCRDVLKNPSSLIPVFPITSLSALL